jgi:ankyrin repeat protein
MNALKKKALDAVDRGDVAAFSHLLEANPELRHGQLPMAATWLHWAAQEGKLPIAKRLLNLGFRVDEPCEDGNPETPLHAAAMHGQSAVVRWLLDHGANVNARDKVGRTPLMFAVMEGDLDTVRTLVRRGADVGAKYNNQTAADLAEQYGEDEIVQLLRRIRDRKGGSSGTPGVRVPQHDERVGHVARHLGPVKGLSLVEIVPGTVAATVHVVPSRPDRKRLTLFTTGLSDRPMKVGRRKGCSRFAELLIDLPPRWALGARALKDPKNYWPIEWLRRLVHHAHGEGGCLSRGDVISNGDPAKPFAPGTKLSSILLLEDDTVPILKAKDGRQIIFYRLMPLYRDEHLLYEAEGLVSLLTRFQEHRISRLLDPKRKNVAQARRGRRAP